MSENWLAKSTAERWLAADRNASGITINSSGETSLIEGGLLIWWLGPRMSSAWPTIWAQFCSLLLEALPNGNMANRLVELVAGRVNEDGICVYGRRVLDNLWPGTRAFMAHPAYA